MGIARKNSPVKTINAIKRSGLRGRSGARFPTWRKLNDVMRAADKERFLIVNAKEGEPGTRKDQFIMKNNPDLLIEGMRIVAHLIKPKKSYIYLNDRYKKLKPILKRAIKRSGADIEIMLKEHKYIAGEDSSLINFIETGDAIPREKPPYPTVKGLHGKPTLVSNVETFSNIPLILAHKGWRNDLQLWSITGDVNKPGVFELPIGMKMKDVLAKAHAENPKVIYFGYSGGCLPYKRFRSMKMTYENVQAAGAFLGCRTMIVYDERKSVSRQSLKIARFFAKEPCGKCIPCKRGNYYIYSKLKRLTAGVCSKKEFRELEEVARYVVPASFCGLGRYSTHYFLTGLKYFREEFEGRCK